jgi:hypothetical protein
MKKSVPLLNLRFPLAVLLPFYDAVNGGVYPARPRFRSALRIWAEITSRFQSAYAFSPPL